jgi:hypothetical protein
MMNFAGHDAGPRGTAIENDFLSTLSVMSHLLVIWPSFGSHMTRMAFRRELVPRTGQQRNSIGYE